jgi:hypothetical protein
MDTASGKVVTLIGYDPNYKAPPNVPPDTPDNLASWPQSHITAASLTLRVLSPPRGLTSRRPFVS